MRVLALLLMGLLGVGCQTPEASPHSDEAHILEIFAAADAQDLDGLDRYLTFVEEDVILMPHNQPTVHGKAAYRAHVVQGWESGATTITHGLTAVDAFNDVVIARGTARGTFQPTGSPDLYAFETKNIFIFKRTESGGLSVWRVIFNMNPEDAS
ncbi:MAG: nuclear transport factor 2 family protein [Bacteroidota bacterium]